MNVLLVSASSGVAGAPGASFSPHSRLAASLVKLGHQVRLVVSGEQRRTLWQDGVLVHELPLPAQDNVFSSRFPSLDAPLTWSQAVYECLLEAGREARVDLVDVPLDGLVGFVTLARHAGPVVARLSGQGGDQANRALWAEGLRRASGVAAASLAVLEEALRSGVDQSKPRKVLGLPDPAAAPGLVDDLARETVELYSRVLSDHRTRSRTLARRVVQVMDALDYGDAVASIARRNARLLPSVGGESLIYSIYKHPRLERECTPFDPVALGRSDGIIFHYWGFTELEGFLRSYGGPKAVDFHNVTPTRYFSPGTRDHEMTSKGHEQLRRIAGCFDLILGDSEYNLDEFSRYLSRPTPSLCLYPTVDRDAVRSRPVDAGHLARLRDDDAVTFLFVGRIARNKRQDRVMEVFDHYWRRIDRRSRLFLVGSHEHSPDYRREVEAFRQELPSRERIVITGKLSDEEVQAYYRVADVFLSASEHEGFGIPLLEAMAHDVPVVALAAAAVPETMGSGGVRVGDWDPPRLAELAHVLVAEDRLRAQLLEAQRRNLARFSDAEAREVLAAAVAFLREGRESPRMVWRGPGTSQKAGPGSASRETAQARR